MKDIEEQLRLYADAAESSLPSPHNTPDPLQSYTKEFSEMVTVPTLQTAHPQPWYRTNQRLALVAVAAIAVAGPAAWVASNNSDNGEATNAAAAPDSTTASTQAATTSSPNTTSTTKPTTTTQEPQKVTAVSDTIGFDKTGLYRISQAGVREKIADFAVADAADAGPEGVVFQKEGNSAIWLLAPGASEPTELAGTGGQNTSTQLAGVTKVGPDIQVIYTQEISGLEENHLRSFSLATQKVTDLYDFHGLGVMFESGSVGFGDTQVALLVDNEAVQTIVVVDLASGSSKELDGIECFDGEGTCLETPAIYKNSVVGFDFDVTSGKKRLIKVDIESQSTSTLYETPWDNGDWYENRTFVTGDTLVVSRSTQPNREVTTSPLEPLLVDLTGKSEPSTLSQKLNIRPSAT